MELWTIEGGRPLAGTVRVQGAKNAALPILAGCLLAEAPVTLRRCPAITDVEAASAILTVLGCTVERGRDGLRVSPGEITPRPVPDDLMKTMRSSVFFLGAMLARCGRAEISLPGGCDLGPRPIDLHLAALSALGAEVTQRGDRILCRAERLTGGEIHLPYPSVGATENVMLCACGAAGHTVLTGAAREPEIIDLQNFLNCLGSRIIGAGTDRIEIRGFTPGPAVTYTVMPDRIACATLLCAAAACGGEVEVTDCRPGDLTPVLAALAAAGCGIDSGPDSIRLIRRGPLRCCGAAETGPYPAFPTDAQPLLMGALLCARGDSRLRDRVFPARFRHAEQFRRLGAEIELTGDTAVVRGVPHTRGAVLEAQDLRGGAALVIAALAAQGRSLLCDPGYIGRGYEALAETLNVLGTQISVKKEYDPRTERILWQQNERDADPASDGAYCMYR